MILFNLNYGTEIENSDIESEKTGHSTKKQDFGTKKTGHSIRKQNLEELIERLNFSKPTQNNIVLLFSAFGFDSVFSRADIIRHTGLTPSPASTLIRKMKESELIEEIKGQGKGKYRFKKQ